MTTFQKLSSLRSEDAQERGRFIQKYARSAAADAGQGKAGAKADKAVVMSYYPHGSAAAIRLNLRWRDPHQVNDFNFDSAGEVQDCQTETEHTGWVILHSHSSISVRHLLLRGAISFTGLYYGTEFPLALAAINAEPVRREGWQCFWQFVRQPKIPVSSKELRKHQPDGALVSPRYAALESTTKREVKSPD